MKPLSKVSCEWTAQLAYAIGLIATDGNLSIDRRHINFTSKDKDLIENFRNCLNLKNSIGRKSRASSMVKRYYVIQFGDVNFYKFLVTLGLTPAKSKTIGPLKIPREYFFDFLRGCIDGDGNIHTFKHPESKNPQLRVRLCSASRKFLEWVQKETIRYGIKGYINSAGSIDVLSYAIQDSIKLLNLVYYRGFRFGLKRKFILAKPYLRA